MKTRIKRHKNIRKKTNKKQNKKYNKKHNKKHNKKKYYGGFFDIGRENARYESEQYKECDEANCYIGCNWVLIFIGCLG